MKRTFILPGLLILGLVMLISSCGPSKVYATREKTQRLPPPPPARPPVTPARYQISASLIISPTPGFRMSQDADGRYYHRSPNGFTYWKGFDNRFYLDKAFINRISYSKWEYKEWKKNNNKKMYKHNRY